MPTAGWELSPPPLTRTWAAATLETLRLSYPATAILPHRPMHPPGLLPQLAASPPAHTHLGGGSSPLIGPHPPGRRTQWRPSLRPGRRARCEAAWPQPRSTVPRHRPVPRSSGSARYCSPEGTRGREFHYMGGKAATSTQVWDNGAIQITTTSSPPPPPNPPILAVDTRPGANQEAAGGTSPPHTRSHICTRPRNTKAPRAASASRIMRMASTRIAKLKYSLMPASWIPLYTAPRTPSSGALRRSWVRGGRGGALSRSYGGEGGGGQSGAGY